VAAAGGGDAMQCNGWLMMSFTAQEGGIFIILAEQRPAASIDAFGRLLAVSCLFDHGGPWNRRAASADHVTRSLFVRPLVGFS